MVLLPDLQIENYRLFQNFKLERLARVNLVAGRNNVGKSALLEAVYLVEARNFYTALSRILRERGESNDPTTRGWVLYPLFFNYRLTENSIIEVKTGKRQLRIFVPPRQEWDAIAEQRSLARRKDIDDEAVIPIRFEHSEKQPLNLFINPEGITTDRRFPTQLRTSKPEHVHLIRGTDSLYDRYRYLAALWDKITLTDEADMVIKVLRIIEPTIEKIDFLSRQNNVKVLLEGVEEPIFIGSLGDGMHHLLMIAVTLANAQKGLLLLDEIETGLHYSVLVDFWRLLFQAARELDVQIIATTHSWGCIAAFSQVWNEVEETEGQFCRLGRVGEQILTEFYPPDELAFAVEQGIEIR